MLNYDLKVFSFITIRIFVNINLVFIGAECYMHNIVYNTFPLIIHGNGAGKQYINMLGNYIPKAWNPKDGCIACLERTIKLSYLKVS